MIFPKTRPAIILTIAAVGILLTAITSAALTVSQQVPSSGVLSTANINVYWDLACTDDVESVEWGFLEPGQTISKSIYIDNNGTVPLTLSMGTTNWQPYNAGNYISLSWNRQNSQLGADQVIRATLTLSVGSNIPASITSFDFNIVISGTEA